MNNKIYFSSRKKPTWNDVGSYFIDNCIEWSRPKEDKFILCLLPDFNWPTFVIRQRPFDWTIDS